MFSQIAESVLPFVENATLVISSGDNGTIRVAFIVKAKKDGLAPNSIVIKGSPAEVEEEFKNALTLIFDKNKALFTNVEKVAEDLKKAAEAKVAKKTVKPVEGKAKEDVAEEQESTPPPPPKEPEFKPTADQKKVMKSVAANLEKAKEHRDKDIVKFWKNGSIKAYKDVAIPEKLIAELEASFDARLAEFEPKDDATPVISVPEPVTEVKAEDVPPVVEPAPVVKEEEAIPVIEAAPIVEEKEPEIMVSVVPDESPIVEPSIAVDVPITSATIVIEEDDEIIF